MLNRKKEEHNTLNSPFGRLVDECFNNSQGEVKNLHYLNILNVGRDALIARIHLIRSAREMINIQTYIWMNDDVGRLLTHELIRAAHRGVKVKLLIDPWSSDKDCSWIANMTTVHPNLELKYYNPNAKDIHPSVLDIMHEVIFNFKRFNQRMHNKLFIIDDQIGITGGRNYENDYYDFGKKRNFKDRDVLLIGPVVKDMDKSFQEYWDFDLSIRGQDLNDVKEFIGQRSSCGVEEGKEFNSSVLFKDVECFASDKKYIENVFVKAALAVTKCKFVVDAPGKDNNPSTKEVVSIVTEEFTKFNQKAKKTMVAQTPYLVLDDLSVADIKRMRKENPDLDIIISTNSLASTDNLYTYSYACKKRKMYVKDLLFRIFEFRPIPGDYDAMTAGDAENKVNICIHAKTFVVDDALVWIGSFNIDPRSFYLNTEAALIIEDAKVAQEVGNDILRDINSRNSWTVGRREKEPVISCLSGMFNQFLKFRQLSFIWPFRYTDNFTLKEGRSELPYYDEHFYDHYESRGPYPDVKYPLKEVEVILLKALIEIARPIL